MPSHLHEEKPKAESSNLVKPSENKSKEPVSKRRKKEMTAFKEVLLEFQKEKHWKAIEFMELEHEAKMQSLLAKQKQKQELHELQVKELLLRIKNINRIILILFRPQNLRMIIRKSNAAWSTSKPPLQREKHFAATFA